MAGHSHWKSIKHKKRMVDAKRGKLFSKLSRLILVAARQGGGDPDMNLPLRYAIDKAKAVSMPAENISRAIKKGTGELEGGQLDQVVYEGYGPGGVAILCDALTDNRNRTTSELRKAFEIHGGKMGSSGCVAWMFKSKGMFVVETKAVDEDRLLEVALEAGAEDAKRNGEVFEVTCAPPNYQQLNTALQQARIPAVSAELTQVPSTMVDLDGETGRKMLRLMDALEDMDDIQNVYSNFNVPDEVMAETG